MCVVRACVYVCESWEMMGGGGGGVKERKTDQQADSDRKLSSLHIIIMTVLLTRFNISTNENSLVIHYFTAAT